MRTESIIGHVNAPTDRRNCNHDTVARTWLTGRMDSSRDYLFVEFGMMSWKIDGYVRPSKRQAIVERCFAEYLGANGQTPGTAPFYYGSRRAPDFTLAEARLWVTEDHGKPWRGAFKIYVTRVDHTPACYDH